MCLKVYWELPATYSSGTSKGEVTIESKLCSFSLKPSWAITCHFCFPGSHCWWKLFFLTACGTDRNQTVQGEVWGAEIGADKLSRTEKETSCSCLCSVKLSFPESWPVPVQQWLLWSLFTLHVTRTGCVGKHAIAWSIAEALAIYSCIVCYSKNIALGICQSFNFHIFRLYFWCIHVVFPVLVGAGTPNC